MKNSQKYKCLKTISIFLFLATIFSCQLNDVDKVKIQGNCTDFPCGFDYSNYDLPLHRVAFVPEYRIGVWLNIKKYAGSQDSIIFHEDGTWSRTNSPLDLSHESYSFDNWYFESEKLNYVTPSNGINRVLTVFNDTTGVFSVIYYNSPNNFQAWDHYIKIQ